MALGAGIAAPLLGGPITRLWRRFAGAVGRSHGVTLIELSITLAITALIIAPLATIIWQLIVVPTETAIEQTVDNQSRNITINIPDDGRSSQVILTGDNPIWATSTWTDFTGTVPGYHKVVYQWDPDGERMLRITSIEGTGDTSFTVARFFDKFADVDIAFREGSPPFLLETALSAEKDSPLGSQTISTSLVSFMRAPSQLAPPAGGYGIFSTDDVDLSGSDNVVIGKIHADGEVRFSCSRNLIANHVEAAGGVAFRVGLCLYLHNDPTPPTSDTPSPGIAVILSTENRDAKGIAIGPGSRSHFLVVDKADKRVYSYNPSGVPTGSFPLTGDNTDPGGITALGSNVWVVDKKEDKVFRYDVSGNSLGSFDLAGANRDARGITVHSGAIWVADEDEETVYQYDRGTGALLGSFPLVGDNEDPQGITTDGTSLWVVDEDEGEVFKYTSAGVFLGSFPLTNYDDNNAEGIATDGETIWVVHKGQHAVFPYHLTGLYKSSLPIDEQGPTAGTLFNYDSDRNADPGLTIKKGGDDDDDGFDPDLFETLDDDDDDFDKFQAWTVGPLDKALVLGGDAYLTFFAAIKDFEQEKEGKLRILLREHDGLGGYVELGEANVTGNDWQGGSTGFVEKTVVFPGVVHTLLPGHLLEVRFIVRNPGGHDMWLAYDTTDYPATLRLSAEFRTGGVPQLFLHNVPTPPVGDTLSPGPVGILGLDNANTNSRGLAVVPGGDLYVVDRSDDQVYRYDSSGALVSTFGLADGNGDPEGNTTDGSSIWVVDDAARDVFKYSLSGSPLGAFSLDPANGDPEGVATDGSSIWVADKGDKAVYRYDTSGSLLGTFALDGSDDDDHSDDDDSHDDNKDPAGITTNGTHIWVVNDDGDRVFKYDVAGTFVEEFELAPGNKRPEGITTDSTSIWVVDSEDDSIYEYEMDGVFRMSLPMDEVAPSASVLFNYDTDRDDDPGLLVRKSSKGLLETNSRKFQSWRTAPLAADLAIKEDSFIEFWSATKNFRTDRSGEISFFIRDRDPSTGLYVEIASGTVFDPDWQWGVEDFVKKSLTIATREYVVPAGHELELKITVDEKSHDHMLLAYDTTSQPSFFIPSITKALGNAEGVEVGSLNGAASAKPIPVSFSESDFQPYTFVFAGDIDLAQEDDVWLDPEHTQLKPGVYFTTGDIALNVEGVGGQVTFVARSIDLGESGSKLTPFKKGVLFFATASDPTGGFGVRINGDSHMLTGIIYSPQGTAEIRGSRVLLDGSVLSKGFDWPGSSNRIAFKGDLFQE